MQVLVSVIDDGQAAAAGQTESASAAEALAIDVFNERLQSEGHWMFAAGLAATSDAKVVDNRGAKPVVVDGPFIESKEFVAGLWIWEVPNLEIALALATEGSKACNRKLEVRGMLGPQ
jgi:hypothetical protein